MNKDIIQGQWTKIKGEILQSWGELTSDQVDKFKGNIAELAGELQTKYGYAKQEVEEKLKDISERVRSAIGRDDDQTIDVDDEDDDADEDMFGKIPKDKTTQKPPRSGYDM